ncbi:MAG: putative metal-binding motif-containing protein [Deltaproteobacteria bacterium]|nr:putative metal-binding motif-containing protein [Deltaproteobacteria bacterium]
MKINRVLTILFLFCMFSSFEIDSAHSDYMAGYTGVGISGTKGVFPKLDRNGNTGIAFANIQNYPATVTLTAYQDDGDRVATVVNILAPCEKVVGSPENIFAQAIPAATYIKYSSDREIVGFQINTSEEGMMLDALPGIHSGGSTLYFPHVASDGNWETEICMINSGDGSISGELRAYTDSGQEVAVIPVVLTSNVRREITVGDEFPNPGSIKYIIFSSDSSSICGYLKFYIDCDCRVAIPAASEINSGDIYISHIASDENWWTGISIVNITSSSRVLTIEFDNGMTRSRSIEPYEHQAFTVRDLFGGVIQPNINSAVIKNASGIVGLELFGSMENSGKNYLSGVLLSEKATTNIYYPHIASDSLWWTGIVAYNPSTSPCNLTITPFGSDGTLLPSQRITLGAKEKYIGTVRQLNFHAEAAWLRIEGTSPISGFELFGINPNSVDDDQDGYTESQGDCNDHDRTVYPGALEICGDGIDQDCDGADKPCPIDGTQDYFPLSVGNRWVYTPSYGKKGDRVDSIIGTETIGSVETCIWNRQEAPDDNYNEKRWLAKNDDYLQVYKYRSNDITDAVIPSQPWVMLTFSPALGETWTANIDLGRLNLRITYYVEAINESINVLAGNFRNCLKIRNLSEISESGVTEYDYKEMFYAPGVGPVLYYSYRDNWNTLSFKQELRSYTILLSNNRQ